VAEWIHVLSFVLPGFVATWTDTFASRPDIFLWIGVLILIGLGFGSWCEQRTRDTMRRVWYAMPATQPATPGRAFPAPVMPSAVNRAIQKLRTTAWYQYAFRLLTHRLMPTAFLLVVGYGALALVTRLVFSIQDSAGVVCLASGSPQDVTSEPSHADFKTNALCSPTGLKLKEGGTYRLHFAIPAGDPWLDKDIPAGPNGVHPDCVTHAMTAGVPLRRRLTQPWFKPMARIGHIGTDDYALDPKPSLPEGETCASKGTKLPLSPDGISFESEIVARSSGELFLYVNDAVLPPFSNHRFYRNNLGSARVTVQLVTTTPP
jgi:hypothetical protein